MCRFAFLLCRYSQHEPARMMIRAQPYQSTTATTLLRKMIQRKMVRTALPQRVSHFRSQFMCSVFMDASRTLVGDLSWRQDGPLLQHVGDLPWPLNVGRMIGDTWSDRASHAYKHSRHIQFGRINKFVCSPSIRPRTATCQTLSLGRQPTLLPSCSVRRIYVTQCLQWQERITCVCEINAHRNIMNL
jgi:hypothetical protein